jgi:hypothetical protein
MRVEICANGISDMRLDADRIATSPVPAVVILRNDRAGTA